MGNEGSTERLQQGAAAAASGENDDPAHSVIEIDDWTKGERHRVQTRQIATGTGLSGAGLHKKLFALLRTSLIHFNTTARENPGQR